MKTKNILSALLSLSIAGIALAGTGEDPIRKKPLTLLGKRFSTQFNPRTGRTYDQAVLYFDMDGNTNTTEVVAIKSIACLAADALVFYAKVGDTKTLDEWRQQLSHDGERECQQKHSIPHEFAWVTTCVRGKGSRSR